METIKVNMSPNPLDVQTIHASQNDGEAREWGFALHNNGEKIDSSSISDQLVFKSYKGGTEQILPENGAIPVTAPFVGDIKYPDTTRTNQEFLYRQSPTEEDGNAKIKSLYGNTLVWNQQIPIPTGQSSVSSGVTVTNNGDGSLTLNGTPSIMNINWWIWGNYATNVSILSLKASHKYFVKDCNLYRETGESLFVQYIGASPVIWSPSADYELGGVRVANGDTSKTYTNVKVYPMIIDLTQMGLDSLTVEQFTSLFPKSYYDYCKGAMLSFGGRNVKFNQLQQSALASQTINGITYTVNNDGSITANGTATATSIFYLPQIGQLYANHKYLVKGCPSGGTAQTYMLTFRCNNFSTVLANDIGDGAIANGQNYNDGNIDIRIASGVTLNNAIFMPQLFDLSEMFGTGNEPSAEGFKELFPNDYYEYNVGQYMNLGQPVSLKTVGKNRFNKDTITPNSRLANDGSIYSSTASDLSDYVDIGAYDYITIAWDYSSLCAVDSRGMGFFDANKNLVGFIAYDPSIKTLTLDVSNYAYIRITLDKNVFDVQIEGGQSKTSYVPYIESTLPMSLSEFPDGMDGFNDIRDEKNETRYVKRIGTIVLNGSELWHSPDTSGNCWINLYAMKRSLDYRETMKSNIAVSQCRAMITTEVSVSGYPSEQSDGTNWLYIRLPNQDQTIANITAYLQEHPVTVEFELYNPLENYGVVDMGSLNWSRRNDVNGAFFTKIDDMALGVANKLSNLLCPLYATRNTAYYGQLSSFTNMEIAQGNVTQGEVYLVNTSYNDVATFKQAMQGVYLLYEKENPRGFTTESLVTENAEIPLSNEDGVLIGKCTEQLSAEPGFHDAKIKLADADGECYSNKIQLHIERSPQ